MEGNIMLFSKVFWTYRILFHVIRTLRSVATHQPWLLY